MNSRERFGIAALASLSMHALALYAVNVPLAPPPAEPPPLEARIVPPPPRAARSAPAPRPAAKPRLPVARRAAPPEIPVPTLPAPGPVAVVPEPQPEAAPAPTPEPAPAPPEPPPAPQQLAGAPVSVPAPAVHSLPRRGRITYTLIYGSDRSNVVGRAVQSWEAGNDSYRLASDAETTGIVEFFRPQRLRYLSRGKITAEGLRPESFLMSRTRRGQTEAARARFDWAAGSVFFGNARDQRSAALPAGSQDIISFIYQFALVPPAPGRLELSITTGFGFQIYELDVLNEETIETPIGMLRALPVRQVPRAGEESLQVWLAAEYRYLPVRIRYFDRDGNPSGEQVVSEIRLSED